MGVVVGVSVVSAVVFIQLFVARRDCVELDRRTGQPQIELAVLVGNARATDAPALNLVAGCSQLSDLGSRCSVLGSQFSALWLAAFHSFAIASRKKLRLIKE